MQCDEEFVKWEERKRWQASNDKLKSHLKEKSSQVEALRANIDRLKDTIVRMEKEKFSLEGKLKANKSKLNHCTIIDFEGYNDNTIRHQIGHEDLTNCIRKVSFYSNILPVQGIQTFPIQR